MWNAPNGHTTFTGPLAFLLAQGIWAITSDLEASFEYDDEFCDYGHPAFDRLTNEQKAWTLHKVAFGLLDRKTEVVHLMAYLEATIATVFRQIEVDLDVEIQMAEEEPDVVVFDNLSSHLVSGVKAAIESAGARVFPLPPYSPDLNPIENVFSKLKTLVRKSKLRTMEELWNKLGELCDVFSPQECLNYLRHAGYQKDNSVQTNS